MAGPYEFLEPEKTDCAPDVAKALTAAYALLAAEAGFLAPEEAAMLASKGLKPPKNWQPGGAAQQTVLLETPAGTVGVLLLPFADPAKPVGPETLKAAVDAARALKSRAALVAVVSPWGLAAENQLAQMADGAIHLLLGAGPGVGMRGRYMDNNRLLWVRAFEKGKSVSRIDMTALPGVGKDAAWKDNENVTVDAPQMDEGVSEDKAVEALFEWLDQPQ